jgi:hypothetical protein
MLENNVGVKTLLNRRERRLVMWHFWSCRTHYPNIYSDTKPMVFSWRQESFLHSYKLLLRATFIDIYAIVMSGHLLTFKSLSYRAITWEGCSIWGLSELSVILMHYFFYFSYTGVFTFGLVSLMIYTDIVKLMTGRLAPNFLEVCRVNTSLCTSQSNYGGDELCTQTDDLKLRYAR